MKKIFYLLIVWFCCFTNKSEAQLISYNYYVSLKNITIVPDNFNKTSLLNYVNGIYSSTSLYNTLNSSVLDVKKTFVGAKTPILKRCIFIKSTNPNLVNLLNSYSTHFEYTEIIPKHMPAFTPNDYLYTITREQDTLTLSNGTKTLQKFNISSNTQLDLIKAKEAWDLTLGHPKVKVGIVDWYIDTAHEDLKGVLDSFFNFSNIWNFHGTFVSGSAVAHSNNGKGIASIAGHKCKLEFRQNIFGLDDCFSLSQRKGIRVVNYSFGYRSGASFPFISEKAINEIVDSNNVVFVSAAGNVGYWGGGNNLPGEDTQWVYPNAFDKTFSVTSVGHMDEVGSPNRYWGDLKAINWKDVHRLSFTTSGYEHHHNSRVDICAPGYFVVSTAPGGGYHASSGTSFAAPIVAGVCALVASVNPCLKASEIKDIVKSTADPSIYNISYNTPYLGKLGKGRVDAYKAVKEAIRRGAKYEQNKTYFGSQNIYGNSIMAGYNVTTGALGNVIVSNNSNLKYDANYSIELSGGFEVKAGGQFEMRGKESPCY